MLRIGIVGWRGLVGSVIIKRMIKEGDFLNFDPLFFSTSRVGMLGPDIKKKVPLVEDAYNIKKLLEMNIIVSCQGDNYTKKIYNKLRNNGWKGFWVDSASTLRMRKDSIIVLDPINKKNIEQAISDGILNYIGGNCTVSLMLMALNGLLKKNWIEWITSVTYQAASGAGAKNMRELALQMKIIGSSLDDLLNDPASEILKIDKKIGQIIHGKKFPIKYFGVPIAANLIPWIGAKMKNGQTKEEWKGFIEANKILNLSGRRAIPIDGQCVRIGAMRCHSQAIMLKLNKDISIKDVEDTISATRWVELVENCKTSTLSKLTPASVSGTLTIRVGRLRKLNLGPKYLTLFTIGDQLLWGAAEPIRRALSIIMKNVV